MSKGLHKNKHENYSDFIDSKLAGSHIQFTDTLPLHAIKMSFTSASETAFLAEKKKSVKHESYHTVNANPWKGIVPTGRLVTAFKKSQKQHRFEAKNC